MTTARMGVPVTHPVVTLEQIRARWPRGFEAFTTAVYQPFAELGICSRCGKNGLKALAFERTEPHGQKIKIVLVCPRCGHAVEV